MSEQLNETSVGCRSNWGCTLKQIMRTRSGTPAASSSKQAEEQVESKKRKLKALVVEDVDEEGNDYDEVFSGDDDSDDADYEVDAEEHQYAEDDLFGGDYEVESQYFVTEHTDKKRKLVSQRPSQRTPQRPPQRPAQRPQRPPPPPQPRVVRRVQRPLVIEEQDATMDEYVVGGQTGQLLGETAQKRGLLVATQLRNCSWKPANFNCRVSAFVDLIKAMKIDEKKIELLQDCGFGTLVNLPSTNIVYVIPSWRKMEWINSMILPSRPVIV